MKQAYPVFIKQVEKSYLVFVPDMKIYTEGFDLVTAMEMARDAIGLKGIAFENDGKNIPEASDYKTALRIAREEADEYRL